MGNKSSSTKDPHFSSESRGRSRSFNGLASRFRKASKSPPRDRSSSFGESTRPQRKGSGRGSQNGALKSSQNGHVIKRGPDIPIATLTKTGVDIPSNEKNNRNKKEKSLAELSQSAPGGRTFHYRQSSPTKHLTPSKEPSSRTSTPSKGTNESRESTISKTSLGTSGFTYNDDDTIIKSSNLKNLKNKQISDKPKLIEDYSESPRMSVSQMRNVSRELFSDQLEDLAKRRGMATLNRDLSLSNASLGLLSNRSKSMHSLSSNDWDYEERCKVGELLSFEGSSKVGELCRSITSQFSSDNQDSEDMFSRTRTNSASAVDLGRYDRKHVAMGATSAEIRRNLASQYAIDPKKSSQKSSSTDNVGPDVISARRMLVARALKDGDVPEKGDDSPSPIVTPQKRSSSPNILERTSSPGAISQGRSGSPISNRSLSPSLGHNYSPDKSYRSSSPALGSNFSPERAGRSASPALGQNITSERSSSPSLENSLTPEKIFQKKLQSSSSSTLLQNMDKSQLQAANMTKSMQKFLLDNQGVGTNSTDYEKLHNKLQKKKKRPGSGVFELAERERSSSFSILSSKQKQQQFVEQMIQEQLTKPKIEEPVQTETKIIHVQSKSYDSTPVSTGGDSGFRSRSQSWSSLSRKSVYESEQHINSVTNPAVNNLWSYSEMSLAELPVDLTSQPQRFISVIEDDGLEPEPENLNYSKGILQKFFCV